MPQDTEGCARGAKASKLGKLKRRLTDLLRQILATGRIATNADRHTAAKHLWEKCRHVGVHAVPHLQCQAIWNNSLLPTCDELRLLLACVNASIQQQQLAARAERSRIWKDSFADSWENGGSKVYQWCKGEENERADMISRPDGSLTCDPEEMDRLVKDAWLPIFQMYRDSTNMPQWSEFAATFGQHIGPCHDMNLDCITADKLHDTLMRMCSKSAPEAEPEASSTHRSANHHSDIWHQRQPARR